MLRLKLCFASFFCISALSAQWQLPPGTSPSNDAASRTTATVSTDTLKRAEKLLEAQDWSGAIALLRPLVSRDAKNAHAQYDLGFALDGAGDVAGARQAYEAAASADSSLMSARVSLGLLLARQNDPTGASKWLREAIALPEEASSNPARAQAYRALARLDLRDAPDKSRNELVAAIRLSEEHAEDVQLSGDIAEALHDDVAAEQAYARVLKASPNDAETVASYARVLLRQGKQAEAEAALQHGLKAHPANTSLLSEQANLLLREQKYDEAIPLLERLRSASMENASVVRLLARAYVAAGMPQKADPLFTKLRQSFPNDGQLQMEYADSLIRQKRNAEAEQVLERALALSFSTVQGKAEAAAKLAFAASAAHHPETVIRAVQLRNQILPADAATTFLSATAHDTLHHTAQAAELYREFIFLAGQAYPDEVWQAQQRLQVLRRAK